MSVLVNEISGETLLTIFLSLASEHTPVRMDRSEAMRYVNRRSDKTFDEFLSEHGIKEATYSERNKREYYTHELAAATMKEYAQL